MGMREIVTSQLGDELGLPLVYSALMADAADGAPDAAAPVADAESAATASEAPPEPAPAPPEEDGGFLFSTRGQVPKKLPSAKPASEAESPSSPVPEIAENPKFHGQRPKQRKPIGDGKKGPKKAPTPRKESPSKDESETQYGPAVSRRAGASMLLMQSSISDSEGAALVAKVAAASEPELEVILEAPTTTPMEDATSATDGAADELATVEEELVEATMAASISSGAKPAVPAKWSSLEGPNANFRQPTTAPVETKGGKKKKKGSIFGLGKKAAVAKFEARTALAYYGTIGGGFGTPRLGLGVALGQFNVPAWVACRPTGELVVSSVFAHEVQMLTPRGGPGLVLSEGPGEMRLDNPQGIAISEDGATMWVANGGLDRIVKYDVDTRSGKCVATAVEASETKSLKMPQGLAIEQNVLFVASAGLNQVTVLDAMKLKLLYSFGARKPDGTELLRRPTDLALYHSHGSSTSVQLYVVDCSNCRLVVFSTDGDFVKTIGKQGTEPGNFTEPLGICIREEKVFVCEGIGGARRAAPARAPHPPPFPDAAARAVRATHPPSPAPLGLSCPQLDSKCWTRQGCRCSSCPRPQPAALSDVRGTTGGCTCRRWRRTVCTSSASSTRGRVRQRWPVRRRANAACGLEDILCVA